MKNYGTRGYGLLIVLGVAWLMGQQGVRPLSAEQAGGLPALERRVAALEAQNQGQAQQIALLQNALVQETAARQAADTALQNSLNARLLVVKAKTAPISVDGLAFTITGKNVFIQDGSGMTDSATGLGNLTVGYNRLRNLDNDRTGTHNLILGDENNHASYGGFVAGTANTISGRYATVGGGFANVASQSGASISAGSFNKATGVFASVLGGSFNEPNGTSATVSGGTHNVAAAEVSSVSGGLNRVAPFIQNWAAGGLLQNN